MKKPRVSKSTQTIMDEIIKKYKPVLKRLAKK